MASGPASSVASEPRCFLPSALFHMISGSYLPVEWLQAGSMVQAADGSAVRVTNIEQLPGDERQVVSLSTSNATLLVTASHRVMVQRGKYPQPVPAASLGLGQHVLCRRGLQQLIGVEVFTSRVCAYKITFSPDKPVESINLPSDAILTRGHAGPRKRRGRLGSRHRASGKQD